MDQLAAPGTALRFEVDTVFRAGDVKTQSLCMATQVKTTVHHSLYLIMSLATHATS